MWCSDPATKTTTGQGTSLSLYKVFFCKNNTAAAAGVGAGAGRHEFLISIV